MAEKTLDETAIPAEKDVVEQVLSDGETLEKVLAFLQKRSIALQAINGRIMGLREEIRSAEKTYTEAYDVWTEAAKRLPEYRAVEDAEGVLKSLRASLAEQEDVKRRLTGKVGRAPGASPKGTVPSFRADKGDVVVTYQEVTRRYPVSSFASTHALAMQALADFGVEDTESGGRYRGAANKCRPAFLAAHAYLEGASGK